MKSSKKFLTRVLTAALAVSMVAGTGVCAAAVEETEPDDLIVIAPEDGEQETPSLIAKLSQTTVGKLSIIAAKIKTANDIMYLAAGDIASMMDQAYQQADAVMAEAETLAAEAEDEEAAAQIMADAEAQANAIIEEATENAKQMLADAQEQSDAFMADAKADFEALKAENPVINNVADNVSVTVHLASIANKLKAVQQIEKEALAKDVELKLELSQKTAEMSKNAEILASMMEDEEAAAQILADVQQRQAEMVGEIQAQLDQLAADTEEITSELIAQVKEEWAIVEETKPIIKKAADYVNFAISITEQLTDAMQKLKEAESILNGTATIEAELRTEFAEKVVAMAESAEYLSNQMDEESAAQFMETVKQQMEKMEADLQTQIDEMNASAQERADELTAEANEELENVKATLQAIASKKWSDLVVAMQPAIEAAQQAAAAVQQKVDETKQAIADAKAKVQEFSVEMLRKLIEKTTKTTELDDGEFSYTIYETIFGTYAIVTGYMGEEENVVIPAYINDVPVKDFMFSSEIVKSVTLPDTITYTTGASFGVLFNLESIEVSEDNANFKSVDGVLYDKSGKKLVAVPLAKEYTIPEGVTSIGEGAFFAHTQMTSIEIPYTVTVIGATAFENCWSLEEVEIPDGVTTIGAYAFSNCQNLKKAVVSSSVDKIYEGAFSNVAEDFAIYCDAQCYAAEYAAENNIKVVSPLDVSVNIYFDDETAYETQVMALGTSVRFEVEALGGSGEYSYACYYKKADSDKWIARQSFKAGKSVISFTPKEAGVYNVCIKVKDTDGTLEKVYFNIEVGGEDVEHTESYVSATNIKLGTQITAYAIPEKGKENCIYAFYYRKAGAGKWSCRQGFSEKDNATITPTEVGEYEICIKIKDETNTLSKKYFNVTVTE